MILIIIIVQKDDEFQDINLHTISSMQFTMTQIPDDLRVAKLKSRYGKYTFVERDPKEKGGKGKIIDVILKTKVTHMSRLTLL